MADPINVRTRLLTREQIAEFIRSPRGIRAFEQLTDDAARTLPDAIVEATTRAEEAIENAAAAAAQAVEAVDAARQLMDAVSALLQASTADTNREDLAQLARRVDALEQGTAP